ncbi:MAG: substrate-binding domain-containing protein, partial [Bacillus sp. (in: firmicutes)]
ASSVTTQVQQIQNAVTKGADIIYVFPAGDAEAYGDTLRKAREAGVKVIVSNNNPGEGAYDAFVGSEEFYMGAMMAAMVTKWIDNNLPQEKNVKALILEAHFNETMAHRNLGMRLISEKFLRKGDIKSMNFVRTEGQQVNYKDENGNVQRVDEPTGGLILDSEGNAILNPFYDPRVQLIEHSNRVSTGVTPAESQAALESAVTKGNDDIQIVMAYGAVGIPVSQKVIEMSKAGRLKNDLNKLAVFCSDATDANLEAISQSANNTTVLRGVMAAGDLVSTLSDFAGKMVRGEQVPEVSMEPLSYIMADSSGETQTVLYTDVEQLSPDIDEFFE